MTIANLLLTRTHNQSSLLNILVPLNYSYSILDTMQSEVTGGPDIVVDDCPWFASMIYVVPSELQLIAVYSRSFRSPLQVPTPQAGTSASSQSSEQVNIYIYQVNRYLKSMHHISHAGARIVVVFGKVCKRYLKSGMYIVRATSHSIILVDAETGGTESCLLLCDK
jgi:hypothetical protein